MLGSAILISTPKPEGARVSISKSFSMVVITCKSATFVIGVVSATVVVY
jgi:hypothetical protein